MTIEPEPPAIPDQPMSVPAPVEPVTTAPAWPTWFRSVDLALGILAVVIAFLIASFASRNADFWRHIATGRLLFQGQYSFGSDPFTYTGVDRPWVNPNWLAEVLFYVGYSMDRSGAVIVAIKAILFAATFAVLFLLRKSTFPLLPWTYAVLLGAIGAGVFAQLRPGVFGLLFQSLILVALFRGNWNDGRTWRMPLCVGGLVALWANCDSLAVLGTLTVGLFALGEFIHRRLFAGRVDLPEAEDPFLPLPPTPALVRTFLVCIGALLLNPTFLIGLTKNPVEALNQLVPLEFDYGTAETMNQDPSFKRYTLSLLNNVYLTKADLGNNLPTTVSLAVIVFSALLMGIGYRHGRASHVLVWLAFALLALLVHARVIGFAMIVSVPFLAANLNGLLVPLFRKPLSADRLRPLIMVSRLLRILSVLAFAVAVMCTFPGWFQIPILQAGYTRYVAWTIDADHSGYRRGAELIEKWRTELPAKEQLQGHTGLLTHPEFGDFAAWFAPHEKTFVNSRYRFHRMELDDLITIRNGFLKDFPEEIRKAIEAGTFDFSKLPAQEVARKYNAAYLCVASFGPEITEQLIVASQRGFLTKGPTGFREGEIWHIDGRFLVVGRVDGDSARISEAMRWQPANEVFGPQQEQLAIDDEVRIGEPPLTGWQYELLQFRQVPPSIEAEDASAYHMTATSFESQVQTRVNQLQQARINIEQNRGILELMAGPPGFAHLLPITDVQLGMKEPDIYFALPILALKAALRGIARNPDDPNGYLMLSRVHQLRELPDLTFGTTNADYMRNLQILTGMNRAIVRYPKSEDLPNSPLLLKAILARHQLAIQYFKTNQIDAMRAVLRDILEIRALAGPNALRYDPLIPSLWDTLYFSPMVEMIASRLQNADPAQIQRFRADPFEVMTAQGFMNKDDHPKNFYPQLRRGAASEDGSTETTELAVRQLKKLIDILGKREATLLAEIERSTQNRPVIERFSANAFNGLPLEAIKVFQSTPDSSRDLNLNLSYVELLYRLGRMEEAHRQFSKEELNPNDTSRPLDPRFTQRLLVLKLQKELLIGDYFQADQSVTQLFQAQFPPMSAPEKALLAASFQDTVIGTGQLMGWLPLEDYPRRQSQLAGRLYGEAQYTFRRGVLALYRGNIPEAKRLFELADKPQGISLTTLGEPPNHELAILLPKYLQLLQKYSK